MGCGNNHNDFRNDSCVCEVVRAIKDIQDNAVENECAECSSCFTEPLGSLVSPTRREPVDTRVFVLSDNEGNPFHAFFNGENNACVSIFFRVEDVFDNCCATLRVLIPGRRESGNFVPVNLINNGKVDLSRVCQVDRFRASNDCITVDLKCFCAVQCIADVNLGICN
ncbi:spore coat protein CotZ [Neobacillus cucumis]|uniref:CotY/CotZ family spore coat protein n=1 Tax=Neobacillus cucumis TaxID=1740721 RepID=UPI0018DFEE16|nr:CotY/CotZ family spore coat protein [Neobacillus cucumis]MBI0579705.1 spore coat protein CotZ [Neobacillus cucumis]WHY93225.1 CotY/CotZ family spore coat protein [Neobacillus cucumis]